jgi:predicted RNA binding protein YcfA (HicA-like mRNA interferase family)
MKLPRDVSGAALVKALASLGYRVTRRSGSHIRLSCESPRQHHITIPDHDSLRIGTLAAILGDVAAHHGIGRDELLERLFGRK